MLTGTCGHTLTAEDGYGYEIALKYLDEKANRIVRHETLCIVCKNRYINDTTLVLRTKTEQKLWLQGKLKV